VKKEEIINKLKGKTAIVTGGTSGMGRGIAELFADEGASVVISGRDKMRGKEVEKTICDRGNKAIFIAGDISDIEVNRLLVNTAVNKFGSLDILAPFAGVLGLGKITELPVNIWHETFKINLDAVVYLIKLAAPEMIKRSGGSIVVGGSIGAFKAFPNHPAYCASKGALVSLVKQIAIDLAPDIRINLICPAQVDTPLLRNSVVAFPNPENIIEETIKRIPMKRLGTPNDIARAAVFLASEDSSWITGTVLIIDGGVMTGV